MTDRPAPQLILASTSASRRAILNAAGVPHEAMSPGVDEAELKLSLTAAGARPRAMADALAEAKAMKIALRVADSHPGALVLGGDQILARDDGGTMDKAADMAELRAQLLSLRGRTHRLMSALVIAERGRAVWRHIDSAKLTVRAFSDEWLDAYLVREGETLLWGVGGYRIEDMGIQLFSQVEGDQFTIRGLPLLPLLDYLRTRGVLAS
ncbi:Maf family protein [Pacificimonas sp. WHA3]|uniref:Nucleoside triphosphate pyrophosphatase n=1 Tax=Pacificimonas pallii TaxID=2827236 RepID=A0ABS6SBL5_9SPHN|nr:Maf family protein [Pacificimonas pallii]MBV7255754.1 Maf family protein [Pacificimonas pallii]